MRINHQLCTIGICHVLLVATEGVQSGLRMNSLDLSIDHRIFAPIDECVALSLIARDAELGIDIVLELMVVAVQVIWRDVEQNGNVGLEIVAVVQLER